MPSWQRPIWTINGILCAAFANYNAVMVITRAVIQLQKWQPIIKLQQIGEGCRDLFPGIDRGCAGSIVSAF